MMCWLLFVDVVGGVLCCLCLLLSVVVVRVCLLCVFVGVGWVLLFAVLVVACW